MSVGGGGGVGGRGWRGKRVVTGGDHYFLGAERGWYYLGGGGSFVSEFCGKNESTDYDFTGRPKCSLNNTHQRHFECLPPGDPRTPCVSCQKLRGPGDRQPIHSQTHQKNRRSLSNTIGVLVRPGGEVLVNMLTPRLLLAVMLVSGSSSAAEDSLNSSMTSTGSFMSGSQPDSSEAGQ